MEMFAMLATTAGGAGVAAGTGTAAAGASSVIGLSKISTAATVLGGLSAIMSGIGTAKAAEAEAVQQEQMATQEELQGRQDALDALRQMNDDQAALAVAGFSSGIGGAGSVRAAQQEAADIGERNFSAARDNSIIKSAQRRGQATQSRKEARGARWGGLFQATGATSRLFQRRDARGVS